MGGVLLPLRLLLRLLPYFNSRPRVGGVEAPLVRLVDCLISILAPAWGASIKKRINDMVGGKISILAPAWGASVKMDYDKIFGVISILAPAWGASRCGISRVRAVRDFNSRPRVGGVGHGLHHPQDAAISILAPAWGASTQDFKVFVKDYISILAPAWGASNFTPSAGRFLFLFQFSPPRGGRLGISAHLQHRLDISILAPAWGASRRLLCRSISPDNFNSRPRVGGVLELSVTEDPDDISILAPAWGASYICASVASARYFNSRPRVGGVLPVVALGLTEGEIFQFSPPRGGRRRTWR